ncbi:hypothetical protein PP423_19145 [Mycobacteroides abscessus]|nr:hypothetical protein [Mycobacteroides abscessus]
MPTATMRAGKSPVAASSRERSRVPVPEAKTTTRAGADGAISTD